MGHMDEAEWECGTEKGERQMQNGTVKGSVKHTEGARWMGGEADGEEAAEGGGQRGRK